MKQCVGDTRKPVVPQTTCYTPKLQPSHPHGPHAIYHTSNPATYTDHMLYTTAPTQPPTRTTCYTPHLKPSHLHGPHAIHHTSNPATHTDHMLYTTPPTQQPTPSHFSVLHTQTNFPKIYSTCCPVSEYNGCFPNHNSVCISYFFVLRAQSFLLHQRSIIGHPVTFPY